jgi:glycosyltransferase involved in cell wall biosynthesis
MTRAEWVRFYCAYTTHFAVKLWCTRIADGAAQLNCPLPDDVEVLCAPAFYSKWDLARKFPRMLLRLVRAVGRSDVILCVMPNLPALPAALIGRLIGKRVVVLAAGAWGELGSGPAGRVDAAVKKGAAALSAGLARHIFVASLSLLEEIPRRWHTKVRFVPITTLVESDFSPICPRSLADAPLLCVSRLVALKRIDVAIEAVAVLRARGITARLRVLGSGPELEALQALVRQRALADAVILEGYVDDVEYLRAAYRTAFAFVMPSAFREGLPRTVVDAMAGGAPVISTAVGGLADLLRHEVNALVVPTGSAESIADAIERLAESEALSLTLAAAGQAAVRPLMQHTWTEALHATVTDPDV